MNKLSHHWRLINWRARVLVVIALFLLVSVAAVVAMMNSLNYPEPDFTLSPWALTYSNSTWHVHFQADTSKYRVGKQIAGAKFILANTLDYKGETLTNDPKYFQVLDNTVDAIGNGYVTFDLPPMNKSCFAIYASGRVQKYSVREGWLAMPSDAWMCAKFDFKTPIE